MTERLAEAMWTTRCRHFGEAVTACPRDERWELYLAYARANIEAMRNPTDEMIDACQRALVTSMRDLGWSKDQRKQRLGSNTKAVMRWNAMIDEALR